MTYRPITPEEFTAFRTVDAAAFGQEPPDEEGTAREHEVFEYDRSLAAFDGDTMVGTSSLLSLSLRIPGGEIACPVVSYVGVARAHRRRGVLRGLMAGLIDDAREHGEALIALFASESTIYGRYGYGTATREGSVHIDRRFSAFRPEVTPGGRIESVDAVAALTRFPPVYEALRRSFTAMPSRTTAWWQNTVLIDPERSRGGASPLDYALHLDADGVVDGYVISRIRPHWDGTVSDGTVEVQELIGSTPEALAALWRYCLDADLCEHLVAQRRARQEPLQYMLADPRRLRLNLVDGLWLRFVDLSAALAARTWTGTDRLTLAVADAFRPDQGGPWTLEVEDGTANCTRGAAEPDLEVDTEGFASCYLGDTRPPDLRAAGRIRELTPGATERLNALLGVTQPPWTPQEF